jgi:hypothetical protein
MWSDPNKRFLWRLKNQQLDLILDDPIFLKSLRHDWCRMETLQKRFAHALSAREIDLPDLVFNLPDTPPDSEGTPPPPAAKKQPESWVEWEALFRHQRSTAYLKKNGSLPSDLVGLIMGFKGPDPPIPETPPLLYSSEYGRPPVNGLGSCYA